MPHPRVISAFFVAGAVAAGCFALFGARLGGAPTRIDLPGLPDPGAFTRAALPLTRTAFDLAAAATLGAVLLAVVLLPRQPDDPGRRAISGVSPVGAAMRLASRCALAWACCATALLVLTLSDVLARPVPRVLSWEILGQFAYSFDTTRALMSSAFLALLTAIAARSEPTPATRVLVGFLAVGALLPPLLTGHAGHARYHALAVTSLSVHVLAACLWVGGLVAVSLLLRGSVEVLAGVLPRFSQVALSCCLAVGFTGALNVWIRLAKLEQLWTTAYGRLALAKTAALLVLAAFGWWHRRRTIRGVRAGRPRAFLLLAASEVAVMLATVGIAVALSRTPPPPALGHPTSAAAAAESSRL